MTRIAVTGVTGYVGGRVASGLAAAGDTELLLVARRPERVHPPAGAAVLKAGYGDADALRAGLAGTDVLFFVSAHESADRVDQHRTVIEAAAAAGVGQIVYTSFVGAADDAAFTLARDHGATERILASAGPAVTLLRDDFYLDAMLGFADADGVIRGPAGDGEAAAVARDDVADAAVAVLRDAAAHRGAVYELTGGEAIGFAELARRAAIATGRPWRYVDETPAEAYASRAHYGAPAWQVEAWVSTYTAIAGGHLARVSDDVPRLTGHPARTLEDVIAGR